MRQRSEDWLRVRPAAAAEAQQGDWSPRKRAAHATSPSTFSYITHPSAAAMPARWYRWNAPVSLAASTPSPTLCSPRSQKRPNASARSAAPTPCLRHGRRVKSASIQPPPYVALVQIVPAAISSPARTTHQSAGSKRSLPRWRRDHDSKPRGA